MRFQRPLMAVRYTGIMSVARSARIDGRASVGGGCRMSRLWLGCLRGVLVLGLALAATGAVAAEGGAAPSESHEMVHLGGPLEYEVINGLVVHDGDIVLGPEDAADGPQPVSGIGPAGSPWPRRRDAATLNPDHGGIFQSPVRLWPGGVIPYEIDRAGLNPDLVGVIEEAIDYFNRHTVLRWVPRTTEEGYVVFRELVGRPFVRGLAHLGTNGGPSSIWIKQGRAEFSDPNNPFRLRWPFVVIHEMGHTAGLLHEHERNDAAEYIDIPALGLARYSYAGRCTQSHVTLESRSQTQGLGPYDYASVMQYSVQSRPLGIDTVRIRHWLRNARESVELRAIDSLSVGDIDAINRMYGEAPQATTISTYPPGMVVTVDGVDYRSPVAFPWPAGSQHVLSVPAISPPELIFARWSDGGSREHSITADPSTTWFTAYYASMYHTTAPTCRIDSRVEEYANWLFPAYESEFFDFSAYGVTGGGSALQREVGSIFRTTDRWVPNLTWSVSSESRSRQSQQLASYSGTMRWFGGLFRLDDVPIDTTIHFSVGEPPAGIVPVWFGSSIPELHGKYGDRQLSIGTDRLDHIALAMVPAEPHRILIEDQPTPLSLPIGDSYADYFVPYWTEMDGLTVEIVSLQAQDLTVLTNLPGAVFRRTPSGFKAVVGYRWHHVAHRVADLVVPSRLPGSLVGNMFVIRVVPRTAGYRGRAERTFSGTVRVHSVKWRGGPARFGDRRLRLFAAGSGYVSQYPESVWVSNRSGRPAHVRLESDQFRLDTFPDTLRLTGSDAQLIHFMPLTDGLEPGMHDGTVRLVSADSRASSTGRVSEQIPVRFYVGPAGFTSRFILRTGLVEGGIFRNKSYFRYGETIEFRLVSGCNREEVFTGATVLDLDIGGRVRRVSGNLGRSTPMRYTVQEEDRDADGPVEVRVVGLKIGEQPVLGIHSAVSVDGSRLAGAFQVVPPADGKSYRGGESIELTYSARSHAVSSTSEVALDIGGRIVPATAREAEGTELHFRYVVQDGDRDADGLAIARAVIRTVGGNEFNQHEDLEELSARSRINKYRVDGSRRFGLPYLERVRITTGLNDEVAGIGEAVGVAVDFDNPVEVTGSPELGLEIGGRRVRATLARAQGRHLRFVYTVRAEDAGAVTLPPGALLLTGGTVRALDGRDAVLDLVPGAFVGHANSEWRVDGSEGVAFLTGVEVAPPLAGDTFRRGEEIRVELRFSGPVKVTGVPVLSLEIGGRQIQLASNRETLVFSYEVRAGDIDADGISIYDGALSVYGGHLVDARDESAPLALNLGWLAIVNSPGHKVDGTAPLRVLELSTGTAGLRRLGASIAPLRVGNCDGVILSFTEPVTLTTTLTGGNPELTLLVGDRRVTIQPTQRELDRLRGGDRSLGFLYCVEAGDFDPDGIEVPADGVLLNGGTLRDRFGVDVDLDLAHLGPLALDFQVDGRPIEGAPQVTAIDPDARVLDERGTVYGPADSIIVQVSLDRRVANMTGDPRLALTIGGRQVEARAVNPSSGAEVWDLAGLYRQKNFEAISFRYDVQPGDRDLDGFEIPITGGTLPITGGTFHGEDGTEANLAWGSSVTSSRTVDGTVNAMLVEPSVEVLRSTISLAVRNGAGTGGLGEKTLEIGIHIEARIRVPPSRFIEVTGSPQLTVEIGNRSLQLPLRSITSLSSGVHLDFRFVASVGELEGELDPAVPLVVRIPPDALSLNGGTIHGVQPSGAAFAYSGKLTHGERTRSYRSPRHYWSGVPRLTGLLTYGPSPYDPSVVYGLGEPIDLCLAISKPVEVTGSPQLALEIGDRRVQAAFSGLLPSAGNLGLVSSSSACFRYFVQADDRDEDGIEIPVNPVSLNGGTIRGLDGDDAFLLLQSVQEFPRIRVDGSLAIAPTVTFGETATHGRDFYHRRRDLGPGEELFLILRSNARVEVTGSPQLALEIGGRRVRADFVGAGDSRSFLLGNRPSTSMVGWGERYFDHDDPLLRTGNTLYFRYVVQAGDLDEDGIEIPENPLSLNGGTIGNGAFDADVVISPRRLEGTIIGGVGVPKIEGIVPTRLDRLLVRFDRPVIVRGSPGLTLEIGDRRVEATFVGMSPDDRRFMNFRYVVQAGDLDEDGIEIPENPLSLNGGTIRSRHGIDANLEAPGLVTSIKVDGSSTGQP